MKIHDPEFPATAFNAAFGNASDDTPFGRALQRINAGASVLIRVPGNMMAAAGEVIKATGSGWEESGKHASDIKGSLGGDLRALRGGASHLLTWLTNPQSDESRPRVIAHNVDMLVDESGRLNTGEDYMTAYFALQEATRRGQVVALADRSGGTTAAALTRLFPEQVSLDELRPHFFNHILGTDADEPFRIASREDLRTLGHRLRFLDPIRATQVYLALRKEFAHARPALSGLLSKAAEQTLTLGFTRLKDQDIPKDLLKGYPGEVRQQLQLVVDHYKLLHETPAADKAGAKRAEHITPGAVLLSGPPGTGKTLAARWLAQEAGLPVKEVSGAEIRQVGWGDAERAVCDLFATARQAAPCCIVLDEADDLLPDRNEANDGLASAERAVVNALLKEMDGFRGRSTGVLLILTTNRRKKLDGALFSRLGADCHLPYPLNLEQIDSIMKVILEELNVVIPEDLVIELKTPLGSCKGECQGREVLKERFLLPLQPTTQLDYRDPQQRSAAGTDLFAPRDIRNALHKLVNPAHRGRALAPIYEVNGDDIERMLAYYR